MASIFDQYGGPVSPQLAGMTSAGTLVGPTPASADPAPGPKGQEQMRKAGNRRVAKEDNLEKKQLELKKAQTELDQAVEEEDIAKKQSGTPATEPQPQAESQAPPEAQAPAAAAPAPEQAAAPPAPEAYAGETEFDDPLMTMLAQQMAPDPQAQELQNKLTTAYEQAQMGDQAELDKLRGLQSQLAQPVQQDKWAPLIKAASAITGEDLTQYFPTPRNKQEELKQQYQIQKDIANLQGKVSDDKLQYLKTMLNRKVQKGNADMLFKLKMAEQRQKRYEDRRLNKYATKMTDQFADMNEKATDEAAVFDNLEGLLMPDPVTGKIDLQNFQTALSNYARVVGGEKGVLTDRDVLRVVPRSFLNDAKKFQAYFNMNAPTALLDPSFAKNLRGSIQRARKFAVKKYKGQLKGIRKSGTTNRFSRELWQYGREGDTLAKDHADLIEKSFIKDEPEAPAPGLDMRQPAAGPAASTPAGGGPGGAMGFDEYTAKKRKERAGL